MSFLRLCSFNCKCLIKNGTLLETLTARSSSAGYSAGGASKDKEPLRKAKTPQGRFDTDEKDTQTKDVLEKFPDDVNPHTKEKGGPRGPEPTRYGDWERKGRCIDF
ncbi:succinate dehydrogenase assembly factor 4, mitochondrial [Hoplias malabaricus]|uniref:succinate dehydrogenase assembly factor 4, mitochondrial n=1 Tax=Hoplias malabaricus TaxID=27720 RepID=UPI0034637AD9